MAATASNPPVSPEPATTSAAAYVPYATAASERMAFGVLGRLLGPRGASGGRAYLLADRVVADYLDGWGEVRGPAAKEPPPSAEAAVGPSTKPPDREGEGRAPTSQTLPLGWEPSEVVRAGLRARAAAPFTGPLWSVLPRAQFQPVVAALEGALGTASPAAAPVLAKAAASGAPALTLLGGGGSRTPGARAAGRNDGGEDPAGVSVRGADKAARDASARMLDALRAHAAAQATANGERISLGEMTTIAFAESKNQLAAATANESAPTASAPPEAQNSQKYNDSYIRAKVLEIANKIVKAMENKSNKDR